MVIDHIPHQGSARFPGSIFRLFNLGNSVHGYKGGGKCRSSCSGAYHGSESLWAHRHGANTTRQTLGREQKGENYEKTPEVKSVALSSRWEGLWEK